MSTPINLNRARKTRARDAKRVKADENAAKFGRTKAQKSTEKAEQAKAENHLDQHRTK